MANDLMPIKVILDGSSRYNLPEHRQRRDGSWFWVDKAIIKRYVPKVGMAAITIYCYLACHASREETCFPSQQGMAKVLGCSRTTVHSAIRALEKHGLIKVDRLSSYPQQYCLLSVL